MTRAEAVAIARSWRGTPYVLQARVKGAGCDCATLLAEYLIEIGAADREDLGVYSHDWFCHAQDERYMLRLLRYSRKTAETICRGTPDAAPGNLVLFRVVGSRLFNHGAIVTEWPRGMHAVHPGVVESNLTTHHLTGYHEMAIFDPFDTPTHTNRALGTPFGSKA
jgi:cell wall-associated NlpC family hydrolase